ncbi:hypothetical protein BT69DRAFT_1334333 [Atractiella rhizophila]|nr:hypothetical protein BT69DRAFT_1334333 [Atractiella rhizophila]
MEWITQVVRAASWTYARHYLHFARRTYGVASPSQLPVGQLFVGSGAHSHRRVLPQKEVPPADDETWDPCAATKKREDASPCFLPPFAAVRKHRVVVGNRIALFVDSDGAEGFALLFLLLLMLWRWYPLTGEVMGKIEKRWMPACRSSSVTSGREEATSMDWIGSIQIARWEARPDLTIIRLRRSLPLSSVPPLLRQLTETLLEDLLTSLMPSPVPDLLQRLGPGEKRTREEDESSDEEGSRRKRPVTCLIQWRHADASNVFGSPPTELAQKFLEPVAITVEISRLLGSTFNRRPSALP